MAGEKYMRAIYVYFYILHSTIVGPVAQSV